MNIFFILLIVFSLLGGIMIKNMSHSNSLGSFLSSIGLKSKEQLAKEQLDKYMGKFLKDQGKYLDQTQEQIGSLSTIVQEASNKNDSMDLLRLKTLMKKFEDENTIMVEDGQKLAEMNANYKKTNKKIAKDAEVAAFLSKSNEREILERQASALENQKALLAQMQDQLKESGLGIGIDMDASDKIETLKQRNQDFLDNLKKQQLSMREYIQDRSDSLRQKMDDFRTKNQDAMDKSRSFSQSGQSTNDRIHDQMQRLRDRMNK